MHLPPNTVTGIFASQMKAPALDASLNRRRDVTRTIANTHFANPSKQRFTRDVKQGLRLWGDVTHAGSKG
jgi:hypothetical protein